MSIEMETAYNGVIYNFQTIKKPPESEGFKIGEAEKPKSRFWRWH